MNTHNCLRSIAILFVLALSVTVHALTPNMTRNRQAAADQWADSVFATLDTRGKVAQLIFSKVTPTRGERSEADIVRLVKDYEVGGLIFSEGSLAQFASLTDLAQANAKVPVLMTIDGEWGVSMRVSEAPRYPKNIALGAITKPRLIYDYGREVARQCRLLNINVNFAPDADVNSNPANPVIGSRSFGENPARVASATVAYSLGLEDGGVQAVAKHFPGHGDTATDSHKALTKVDHSRAVIDSVDLVPFKNFVEAGCSGIMTGHIIVPALDPSATPASLSHIMTNDMIRGDLGFEGLIYTDALGMKGAVDPAGRPNEIAALQAGADVLLCPNNTHASINTLMKALSEGTISQSIIDDRCLRVLRYKYYLGLNHIDPIGTDYQALISEMNSPQALALMQTLADASITVTRNNGNILPLGDLAQRTFAIVNIGSDTGSEFSDICARYARTETYQTYNEAIPSATLAKIESHDVVIALVCSDNEASRHALAQLTGAKKPVIGVFMISPFKIRKFGEPLSRLDAMVLAYDDIPVERRAAAQAIFGGISVSGRLPVNIAGVAKAGDGIDIAKSRLGFTSPVAEGFDAALTDSLDALARQGLDTKAFPGCQILVARHGNIVYDKAFGKITGGADAKDVDASTVYDLASVSKAIGTLPGVMKAYDQGYFTLDDSLATLIPAVTDSAKRQITVRQLLYHETGMPAAINMYDVMFDTTTYAGRLITSKPDKQHTIKIQNKAYGHKKARMRTDITSRHRTEQFPVQASNGIFTGQSTYDTIMSRIYNIPLRANKNYNYSCLNFALLMDIEQRATGKPHQDYVQENIYSPIGAYSIGYRPAERLPLEQIAPTEYDSFLRRQKVHGYVHDEMANFSGGVQGNAGLFANADDIAKVCQMWLNGGKYGDVQVLSKPTVELFTTAKSPTCRRGLGFDKPDTVHPDWSPTCDEASPEVYGHLGFTGTVFWVDPKEDIIFIFLTNRVDPTRDNAAFNRLAIRPRLFSQVYQALTK